MKKTRAQFILLVMIAFIIIPVAADSQNTTNSTTVPTLTETNLTTATMYPVNNITTVIPTNATPEQITTNATVSNATTMIAATTGTSVVPSSTGNLTVASSPLGASILIDGVLYGNTPENLTGISVGNHIVRLTMSGYYDYEGTVYVVPGQVTDVFGTLPPLSASSSVSSSGSTAQVTATTAPEITVQPTSTSSGGLLDNPTIVASILGIVAASIGAVAAIFPHLSKFKK